MTFKFYIGGVSIGFKKNPYFGGPAFTFKAWIYGQRYYRFKRKIKALKKSRLRG